MSVTVSGRIIKLYLIVPNRAPHYIVILYRQRSTYTAVVPPPVFVNRTPYHRYTHARKEINADIRNTFQDILSITNLRLCDKHLREFNYNTKLKGHNYGRHNGLSFR